MEAYLSKKRLNRPNSIRFARRPWVQPCTWSLVRADMTTARPSAEALCCRLPEVPPPACQLAAQQATVPCEPRSGDFKGLTHSIPFSSGAHQTNFAAS